jgi:hypothetical protein
VLDSCRRQGFLEFHLLLLHLQLPLLASLLHFLAILLPPPSHQLLLAIPGFPLLLFLFVRTDTADLPAQTSRLFPVPHRFVLGNLPGHLLPVHFLDYSFSPAVAVAVLVGG